MKLSNLFKLKYKCCENKIIILKILKVQIHIENVNLYTKI